MAAPYNETFWAGYDPIHITDPLIFIKLRQIDWKDVRYTCTQFGVFGTANEHFSTSVNPTNQTHNVIDLYMQLKQLQRTHRGRSQVCVRVPDHVVLEHGGALFVAALHVYVDSQQVIAEPVDTPELQYSLTHIEQAPDRPTVGSDVQSDWRECV
jgi:hypothetical protein